MARGGVPRPLVRRPVSITVLIVAVLLTFVVLPVGLLIGGLFDLAAMAGGDRRFRRVRGVLLVCALLVVDFVWFVMVQTILLTALVRGRDWREARLHWMMDTWSTALLRVIGAIVPVTFDVEALADVPLQNSIIIARHRSHLDALLPAWLIGKAGLKARYTLKEDLRWEPNIDIVGHALPHRFVTRAPENLDAELEAIRELAGYVDESSAAVIFPEGTFFSERRKQQIVRSLDRKGSRHVEAARSMQYLLPPRPGGTLSLLEGAPHADVIILGHSGFEAFGSIRDILRNLGGAHRVHISAWRIRRTEVPTEREARIDWLFERWLELDRWVAAQHREVQRR